LEVSRRSREAVRHADPCHLAIELSNTQDCIILSVADDGCGFIESGDLLGFGLRGMRRRAAAISARLEIVSSPGEETRVRAVCPLAPGNAVTSFFKRGWKAVSAYGSQHARKQ
jgi:glucose-6-phosphate-specific signal transduction histidine kinase